MNKVQKNKGNKEALSPLTVKSPERVIEYLLLLTKIQNLIKKYPNDMELGAEIRKIFAVH